MKIKFLALALVAAAPFAASADVSYKYFDVSYQTGSAEDALGSADFDGFMVDLSYGVSDNWFIAFDYLDASFDPAGDLSTYGFALGWHSDLIYATVGYETLDGGGSTESGPALELGLRTMVGDNFEVNGHVGYSDIGDIGTFTSYGVGGVFMFGDNMGISFSYGMDSSDMVDLDSMGVGFRLNFD